MCAGADDGTRTRNRRFTKPLLYQLSYVGATGRAIPQKTHSAPGNDRAGRRDGSSVRLGRAAGAGRRARRSVVGAARGRLAVGSARRPGSVPQRRRRVRSARPSAGQGSASRRRVVAGRRRLRPARSSSRPRSSSGLRRRGSASPAARLRSRPSWLGFGRGSRRGRGSPRRRLGGWPVRLAASRGSASAAWAPVASAAAARSAASRGGRRAAARPSAGSRWATASNSRIEPATAALSDPIAPRIGIRTNRSHRRRTAGPRPWPSLPTTMRERPAEVRLRAVSGASPSAPAIRRPRACRSASAPGEVVDRARAGGARRRPPTP